MMEAAEREARADLAAAFRLSVRFGFHEGIDNHFSYALDGDDPLFILNPFGPHWSELRASDLQTVDIEGKVVRGEGPPETSAFASTRASTWPGQKPAACCTPTCPTPRP